MCSHGTVLWGWGPEDSLITLRTSFGKSCQTTPQLFLVSLTLLSTDLIGSMKMRRVAVTVTRRPRRERKGELKLNTLLILSRLLAREPRVS